MDQNEYHLEMRSGGNVNLLYYTPPDKTLFDELKKEAITISFKELSEAICSCDRNELETLSNLIYDLIINPKENK